MVKESDAIINIHLHTYQQHEKLDERGRTELNTAGSAVQTMSSSIS